MSLNPYYDPFLDENGNRRRLFGAAVLTNAPKIAEMVGRIGYDAAWIEFEHGGTTFAEAEVLCMAAEAGGAVPTLRLPSHSRENILKALEIGAKIVVVPMINDADTAREMVRWGKFAPLGERGFNTRSRGMNYALDGLANITGIFEKVNASTHLIAQIETVEAMDNLDAILAVEGISGILVGPADLSASMGIPGQFTNPELIAAVTGILTRARAAGKVAGIMVVRGPLLEAALQAGSDLCFFSGDLNDLTRAWRENLEAARKIV